MNTRSYNWISHSCIFVIVVSALLFDKIPRFKWIFAALGLLSGLVALGIYFYNQWVSSEEPKLEDSKAPALTLSRIEWHQPSALFESDVLAKMLLVERHSAQRYFDYNLFLSKSQQEDFNRRIAHALAPLYSA